MEALSLFGPALRRIWLRVQGAAHAALVGSSFICKLEKHRAGGELAREPGAKELYGNWPHCHVSMTLGEPQAGTQVPAACSA